METCQSFLFARQMPLKDAKTGQGNARQPNAKQTPRTRENGVKRFGGSLVRLTDGAGMDELVSRQCRDFPLNCPKGAEMKSSPVSLD